MGYSVSHFDIEMITSVRNKTKKKKPNEQIEREENATSGLMFFFFEDPYEADP